MPQPFHFISKDLEAQWSYFLKVTQSGPGLVGPGPCEAVCILRPASVGLSGCTPVPTSNCSSSSLYILEPSAGRDPYERSHPSSVPGFPEVPPWAGCFSDCGSNQMAEFDFSRLRIHDFSRRVSFKVVFQKFKEIWRHKQVVFNFSGVFFGHCPPCPSLPRSRLFIWFVVIIILLIQFCTLLFSTCVLSVWLYDRWVPILCSQANIGLLFYETFCQNMVNLFRKIGSSIFWLGKQQCSCPRLFWGDRKHAPDIPYIFPSFPLPHMGELGLYSLSLCFLIVCERELFCHHIHVQPFFFS